MNELHLFAGAGAVSSAASFSDIPASVLLKLSHTVEGCCCKDKETVFCPASRYGTTLEPSTASRGADSLTLCAADSHAKTFQVQEKAQGLMEQGRGFGLKCSESLAKFDPISSSWKTAQTSLFGGGQESLEIWPDWAMWDRADVWELMPPDLTIIEPECGWWPTPLASDWKAQGSLPMLKRQSKECKGQNRPQYEFARRFDCKMPIEASEKLMGWPIGWTDLKPLATDKFRQWLNSHGRY